MRNVIDFDHAVYDHQQYQVLTRGSYRKPFWTLYIEATEKFEISL